MATATRPLPTSLVDVLDDEPEGPVPSPFPVFEVRRQTDERLAHQAHRQDQNSTAANSTDLSPIEAQAVRSLADVQEAAIHALKSILDPHIPLSRPTYSSSLSPTSSASSFPDSASELQFLLSSIVDSDALLQMESRRSMSDLLGSLSKNIDSRTMFSSLSASTRHLARSLLTITSYANTLIDEPSRPTSMLDTDVSAKQHLDLLVTSLRHLYQTSALETIIQHVETSSTDPHHTVQRSLAATYLSDAGLSLMDEISHWKRDSLEVLSRNSAESSQFHPLSDIEQPPEYDYHPPAYVYDALADEMEQSGKVRHVQSAPDLTRLAASSWSEKMQLELDDVALAIERLYEVSPQLKDQRVELNTDKRQELELARIMGSVQRLGNRLDEQRASSRPVPVSNRSASAGVVDKGKGRAQDSEDLEDFLEFLGASQRPRLANQRATISDDVSSRLRRIEAVKAREASNRDAFVDRIKKSVETGRLQSQDAVFSRSTTQDKTNLLTLPEFIHESSSEPATSSTFSESLSHISEFTSPPLSRKPSISSVASGKALKSKRSLFFTRPRSHSAPAVKILEGLRTPSPSEPTPELSRLQYVAEHQENLHSVSVLVTLPAGFASSTSYFVSYAKSNSSGRVSSINVRLDPKQPTFNIRLPVYVTPGGSKPAANVKGDYLEIKIPTDAISNNEESKPLLDAARLNSYHPTAFICGSCSLPLIQCVNSESGRRVVFSDLPSEYWTELVEAWMCHSEQKLSGDVVKQGKGPDANRPSPDQILVGGSYILVDASAVKEDHMRVLSHQKNHSNWRHLRCICGAALGARQLQAEKLTSTLRFAKYAIRPVGSDVPTERPPLSAYIIADMLELVAAHASYRFIIHDEEDEQVKMLIWLFNPSVRISHSVAKAYALPRTGISHSAKVMFKLVGPTEQIPVDRLAGLYPDFAEAEHLYYPLSVCHSLAVLLRNSNVAYPESCRKMGALSLGWLRRV